MSFSVKEVTVDSKDSSILHVTLVNAGDLPRSVAIYNTTDNGVATGLIGGQKSLRRLRIFMVTRRSIANPDEIVKLRVQLMAPVMDFSPKAFIQLAFKSSYLKIRLTDAVS
jgi:hypothetical protein